MILLILFLLIVISGLAWFVIVYLKEAKGGEVAPLTASLPVVGMPESSVELIELKVIKETLESKLVKLEQILEEKNALITELQRGAVTGQDPAQQVDQLKEIFQNQIEELKVKNSELKEDLDQALQENLDLQTRIYGINGGKQAFEPKIEVEAIVPEDMLKAPEPEPAGVALEEPELEIVIPPADKPVDKPVRKIGGLSLHDIFSDEKDGQ